MDETGLPETGNNQPATRSARGGYALAVLALLACLLLVAAYWRGAYERQMDVARNDFVVHSEETAAMLAQRLDSYELVTRGGVSLVASVAQPTRRQWQNYVEGLNIGNRFPALVGLGFAVYATPVQLSALQVMLRDSGEGLFSVRPRGPREHYGAVLYLGPRSTRNLAALGYDMFAHPVRHAAMRAARDSGQPRLSGRVQLVQDSDAPTPSLLLYQPVYRSGDRPTTVEARRLAMQGWVYVAFGMRKYVETALSKLPNRGWLRIVDTTGSAPQQLYSDPAPADRRQPAFVHRVDLDAYGRRWQVEFRSQPMAVIEGGMTGLRTMPFWSHRRCRIACRSRARPPAPRDRSDWCGRPRRIRPWARWRACRRRAAAWSDRPRGRKPPPRRLRPQGPWRR